MVVVPISTVLRRKGVVAGIAVLTLAASACGSSSTAGNSSSSSSSASESSSASSSSAETSSSSPEMSSGAMSSGAMSSGAMSSGAMSSGAGTGSAGGSSAMSSGTGSASGDAKTASSAADLGGMDGLAAAANKEGALNLIALPPEWADYKEVISGFQAKYPGIKVTSAQPDANSQEEIQAAKTSKGTDKAPDVFDVGAAVALANTDMFAPYKVAAWKDIPDANKEATGLYVNDYTGVMTVGYDSTLLGKDMTTLDDLKDSALKGQVALNGNPTQANAGLQAVMMASLAKGGSLDDISKGVDFFASLKQAGTLNLTKASAQLVKAGTISAVVDWSYNQPGYATAAKTNGDTWKSFTPSGVNLGAYYDQAVNKDAPHPAAARLWEEYLYTADAQNLWIKGGALPILYNAMKTAGTINAEDAKNLPVISGTVQEMKDAQTTAANKTLAATWSKAVS